VANIILPRRNQQQPQYPAEPNKQGFVWLPHTGDIGSTNLIQAAGVQITSASLGGVSAYNAGSTTNRIEYLTPYVNGDMTIIAVCSFVTVGSGRTIAGVFKGAGTAVANYISLETSGKISAVSTDNGNWQVALGRIAEVGKLYSIVGTFKSGGKRNLFVNGVKDAENTTARAPAGMTSLLIGSYLASASYSSAMTGHINLSAVLPVYLSDEEARGLSENPWQLFKAKPRVLYFDVGGGISGTLAVTLENFISSITGTTTVTGTVNNTIDNVTSSITGTTGIIGTISNTLENNTSNISGTILITGTLSKTLDDFTSSISGALGQNVSGTISVTTEDNTSTITGSTAVTGTITVTVTLADATLDGTTTVLGTITQQMENFTSSIYGFTGAVGIQARLRTLLGMGT